MVSLTDKSTANKSNALLLRTNNNNHLWPSWGPEKITNTLALERTRLTLTAPPEEARRLEIK